MTDLRMPPAPPGPRQDGGTAEALQERIKELSCLYAVSRLAHQPGLSLQDLLQRIADTLPPAWQYPEHAGGLITFDGRPHASQGFVAGPHRQEAAIVVNGATRGAVAVHYDAHVPDPGPGGPFLPEERHLIEGLAREIALIVERRAFDEDRERLKDQLRHADRLATLGQLSAGVAHELNEPLGGILGFAQLAQKDPALPHGLREDMGRIVAAALHAREVIRKLLLFSRQALPRLIPVHLNQVVEEGLYLLESRCAKEGVQVVRDLEADLPPLTADPSQLHQALVNLVVNALQAMPGGGTLTLRTRCQGDQIQLAVADTGTGMDEVVLAQLFTPFFTTKEVGQGTGLGLSVVHGIITAHGGTIQVTSQPGAGSCFTLVLPLQREVP